VRDAERFAKALATPAIGFRVTLLKNPDRRTFLEAIETFGEVIAREKGVGLFYFSGHGMQHEGENYLVPAAADPRFREDLPTDCVAASRVMVRMMAAGNGTNLLFLDACRDSPLPSARNKGAIAPGLAQMSGSGLLIGFAADSGKVALDSGQGSRYTNALLKHLPTQGISVAELLTRVRRDVVSETAQAQEPFVYMGLDELFSFVPGTIPEESKEEVERLQKELEEARSKLAAAQGDAAAMERLEKDLDEARRKLISAESNATMTTTGMSLAGSGEFGSIPGNAAEATVIRYYDAIDRRDIDAAYGMRSSSLNKTYTSAKFKSTFLGTQSTNLLKANEVSNNGSSALVEVSVNVLDNKGQWTNWAGKIALVNEGGVWKISSMKGLAQGR
jgi:hypothetical protein